MAKAKMGRMMMVGNKNPRPNASSRYIALWVEDEDGDNERCLMFRESDVGSLSTFSFPESLGISNKMKFGRLYNMTSGSVHMSVVKVVMTDGNERIVRMSDKKISSAESRAIMNKEDIPDRGIINDILD